MNSLLKLNLQLFGEDESAGGAEVSTDAGNGQTEPMSAGNEAQGVDAQPQREGRRQNIFPRVPKVDVQPARTVEKPARRFPTAEQPAPKPQTAAQAPAEAWADVKKRYSAEYGADVRAAVNERFKNHEAADKRLNEAMETLAAIAPFYGVQSDASGNLDLAQLKDKIQNDRHWYEQIAMEKGIPVETAMLIHQLEMQQKQREAENRRSLEQEQLQKHFEGLRQQEGALKNEFPDFSLEAALQDPVFVRMTSPGGGYTVKQAYFALHGDELLQRRSAQTAAETQKNMSRAIQSGAMRPQENGMAGNGGGVPAQNFAAMTREQWKEFNRRAQAGERIRIG